MVGINPGTFLFLSNFLTNTDNRLAAIGAKSKNINIKPATVAVLATLISCFTA